LYHCGAKKNGEPLKRCQWIQKKYLIFCAWIIVTNSSSFVPLVNLSTASKVTNGPRPDCNLHYSIHVVGNRANNHLRKRCFPSNPLRFSLDYWLILKGYRGGLSFLLDIIIEKKSNKYIKWVVKDSRILQFTIYQRYLKPFSTRISKWKTFYEIFFTFSWNCLLFFILLNKNYNVI